MQINRRECLQLGVSVLAAALAAACSGSEKLTAPEPVIDVPSQPIPETPFDLSQVGKLFATDTSENGGTLYSVLEQFNWAPGARDFSGIDTETGKPFSGFMVTTLKGASPKQGFVIAINNGHFFSENIQTVLVEPRSRIDVYYGLPCSDSSRC